MKSDSCIKENTGTILVTGAAGFLGFHTCKMLILNGYQVIGVDSLVDDVNTSLKIKRLDELGVRLTNGFVERISNVIHGSFSFFKSDIRDSNLWNLIKNKYRVNQVIHLAIPEAKKADVLSSKQFALNNFEGFIQILDFCRETKVDKLFYAHTMELNYNSMNYVVDERYTLNNTIQWMNDHWASAFWELYNLQALALEFPQVLGELNRLDGLSHEAFGDDKKVVGEDQLAWNSNYSSTKYCTIDKIINPLLELIENQNSSFHEVTCGLGLDSWKGKEELKSKMKA
jgi:UDP-glucuronate 4-epimerase